MDDKKNRIKILRYYSAFVSAGAVAMDVARRICGGVLETGGL